MTWRYAAPFARSNPEPADLFRLLDPTFGYRALHRHADELVAVCCFGLEARVTGGNYTAERALDVGLALRPDLLGQGWGRPCLQAVLDFARREYQPTLFRVTVAADNTRALRLCERVGFHPARTFTYIVPPERVVFVQLLRPTATHTYAQ